MASRELKVVNRNDELKNEIEILKYLSEKHGFKVSDIKRMVYEQFRFVAHSIYHSEIETVRLVGLGKFSVTAKYFKKMESLEIIKVTDDGVRTWDGLFKIACYRRLREMFKERLDDYLSYIYFTQEDEGMYGNMPYDIRIREVARDIMGDENFTPPDLVRECMAWYLKTTDTPLKKLIRQMKIKVYEAAKLMEDEAMTLDNASKFEKMIKLIPVITANIKEASRRLGHEKDEKGSKSNLGMFEE